MKKMLVFSALPFVFLFVTAFQSSNSVPAQLAAIQAKLDSLKGPRKFYVTKTSHTPAEALSACAPGYHMASMWELHDPSNLRYNTELGKTLDDSGFGPPVSGSGSGWIRTGYVPYTLNSVGAANCSAWSSVDGSHYGTYAYLNFDWDSSDGPPTPVSPWKAATLSCAGEDGVWCVED